MFLGNRKTKIIATIGPASDSSESLESLIKAGVNIFRFNMKHEPAEMYRPKVERAQAAIKKLGANVGILFDLQGPDIRVDTTDKAPIETKNGDKLHFGSEFSTTDAKSVKISHSVIFEELNIGDSILIDDGFYEFKVIEKTSNGVYAEAQGDCLVKNRKGLNLPEKKLSKIPALTQDDLDKLDLAAEMNADFIAISFCRSKADVTRAREEMAKRNLNSWVVSKIENQEGLNNLDEIIEVSDAIMIARGDLGIEIPIERIAHVQKMMAFKCRAANKPVITATQMLESMCQNARPTRAEATDVSNAVFYGTDAIMLSGETAAGKFPLKAVETMAKIAAYNEEFAPTLKPTDTESEAIGASHLLARTAVAMIEDRKDTSIDKVIVFTESGFTSKVISSYRLKIPTIAVTENLEISKRLTISYGIKPIFIDFNKCTGDKMDCVIEALKQKEMIKTGETVLIISGMHFHIKDINNSIRLLKI